MVMMMTMGQTKRIGWLLDVTAPSTASLQQVCCVALTSGLFCCFLKGTTRRCLSYEKTYLEASGQGFPEPLGLGIERRLWSQNMFATAGTKTSVR